MPPEAAFHTTVDTYSRGEFIKIESGGCDADDEVTKWTWAVDFLEGSLSSARTFGAHLVHVLVVKGVLEQTEVAAAKIVHGFLRKLFVTCPWQRPRGRRVVSEYLRAFSLRSRLEKDSNDDLKEGECEVDLSDLWSFFVRVLEDVSRDSNEKAVMLLDLLMIVFVSETKEATLEKAG